MTTNVMTDPPGPMNPARRVKLRDGRNIAIGEPTDAAVRYNVYECEKGHHNLSMDVDEGVTPMFLTCRRRDNCGDPSCWCGGAKPGQECGGTSSSMMYPAGPPPKHLFPVKVVWRKATNGELRKERREGGDHFSRGGLQVEWV